ncbi:reverse transcriptase family protein [Burkholderiaceae bacterium UC74_6]
MRLPQLLLESQFFQFETLPELLKAVEEVVSESEIQLANALAAKGLPPITSRTMLAAMIGISPGLVWSFTARPQRHYRSFDIPKGQVTRRIDAPRVALKVVQKWISCALARCYQAPAHVYGFVPGVSHVNAAAVHCGARWVFSVDIRNFFPSTHIGVVVNALKGMGFDDLGAALVAQIGCLRDGLAQGSPSSPVLSNICFSEMDAELARLAAEFGAKLTRYADDIVFSGCDDFPEELRGRVLGLFLNSPWRLAEQKTHLAVLPQRLKVHGLLVHGAAVRLTKGYRNRIRAYEHLLKQGKIRPESLLEVKGHVAYGEFVGRVAGAVPQP